MKGKKTRIVVSILLLVIIILIGLTRFVVQPKLEQSLNRVVPHRPYPIREEVARQHADLTIVDWHSDSLLWARDLLKRSDYGHVDIPRLQQGNVAIQTFIAVTKSPRGQNYEKNSADSDNITALAVAEFWPPSTWNSLTERALYQARRLHGFSEQAPELFQILKNREQLRQLLEARQTAREKGTQPVIGGMLGIEGCHALEGKLGNVKVLYDAGYRMMGLHHFFDNKLGGSLHGTSQAGLSEFGKEVVRELDKQEIIIDLAHSSTTVVDDVLAIAKRPMVVSHTGVYGVCKSARNIPDAQLKQIAWKGGLIAIGYWEGAVCDISPKGVVKSIRYAIDLLGEDYVALGSDFDGSTKTTFDTSELAILTQTMVETGFSDREISKVMGGNTIKFLLKNLPE